MGEQTQQFFNLKNNIEAKKAVIGIVGLGYVGLPFAIEKIKVGFQVLGIEQNVERVQQVNQGKSYINDVKEADLKEAIDKGKIKAVPNFDDIAQVDVVVICVPTPLTRNLTPDLSYIESVTKEIAARLRPGQLITLESTTYPGTTDEIMKPILETKSGLIQGEDFFLAHSPERVDPGNKRYTTKNTNKVVGASDPNSLEIATLFYEQTIEHVVAVNSAKAAELVKVFENTFRAVNIALVNELALLCDRMNLNVWEVLDAANTKPFGIMPFYPGPGVGGHCIPLDPHYLEWKAREFNFETHFIGLAGEINRHMPEFVRQKVWRVLNQVGIAPSQSRVLIIGATYKKDLADARESPSLKIMDLLVEDEVDLSFWDPYIPKLEIADRELYSVELTDATISASDLVVIATDHSQIDYLNLVHKAKAVLDTRGITRHMDCNKDKVTLL